MALHTYSHGDAEVEYLAVSHPQFSRQLVDADVLWHGGYDVLLLVGFLLIEFCSFKVRSPVRRGSSDHPALTEPLSDAIGWGLRSPVETSPDGSRPAGGDSSVELVCGHRPAKRPSQVCGAQAGDTGSGQVDPGAATGLRPAHDGHTDSHRPCQPDQTGDRAGRPTRDARPLGSSSHSRTGKRPGRETGQGDRTARGRPTPLPHPRWPPRSTDRRRRQDRPRRAARPVRLSRR